MVRVASEVMYFTEESPEGVYLEREDETGIDESMVGTEQVIDGEKYLIKSVIYRPLGGEWFRKVVIVE